MIDDYLNQQHPNLISEAKNRWQQCSQEISVFIKHDDIDLLHLAAIVDVLRNNWKYEQQMYVYYKKSQQYTGAIDLKKFLNEYQNKNAIPRKITIEFKTLYEKGDKSKKRTPDSFNKMNAGTVVVDGRELIKYLMKQIAQENSIKLIEYFSSFQTKPLSDDETYKKNKIKFRVSNQKLALYELINHFNLYQSIPVVNKKIYCIKLLIYIGLIDSYVEYKRKVELKNSVSLKVEKIKDENTYYREKYTDLTKERQKNAEG